MSRSLGVFYVKRAGEWVAHTIGNDVMPKAAFGAGAGNPEVFASKRLSEQFGEAIYIFEDERNDQLYYDHARDGVLLRKLMYVFDGGQSSWVCVAGEPEPWEDELFKEDRLDRALRVAEDEDHDRVRQIFSCRTIELGASLPSASSGHWIEAHFGITRPKGF